MLPSGNDAAICLAVWGGKQLIENKELEEDKYVKEFIVKMNSTANSLQLIDTRYTNPHGLPHRDNRSSAYDVALLTDICL